MTNPTEPKDTQAPEPTPEASEAPAPEADVEAPKAPEKRPDGQINDI